MCCCTDTPIPAAGSGQGNIQFDFTCPQGHITTIAGNTGIAGVDALGPVQCSDAASSDSWGTPMALRALTNDTWGWQKEDVQGFTSIGVVYAESSGLLEIWPNAKSEEDMPGYDLDNKVVLKCPLGMSVSGVYGSYTQDTRGIDQLGVYCRSGKSAVYLCVSSLHSANINRQQQNQMSQTCLQTCNVEGLHMQLALPPDAVLVCLPLRLTQQSELTSAACLVVLAFPAAACSLSLQRPGLLNCTTGLGTSKLSPAGAKCSAACAGSSDPTNSSITATCTTLGGWLVDNACAPQGIIP